MWSSYLTDCSGATPTTTRSVIHLYSTILPPSSYTSSFAISSISYSSWPWYSSLPVSSSGSSSSFSSSTTGYIDYENYDGGPPIAAIIGGVLGTLFTLILSLVIFLCRRRRTRFQKLKRHDSLVDTSTPMSSQYSSSFFKPYGAQDHHPHTSSYESPSNPFSGGIPHPPRGDPISAISPSTSRDPAILEELNSLRKKIKDLEELQQSMPEHTHDSKNGTTPLFLSYQHSGTESLPQYDSVSTHNLYGYQPHTSRNSKTQCFCSSCSA